MKIYIIFGLICLLLLPQCKKEEAVPGPPSFDSLEEEIDFLVGKYLKVGAVVGVIDKDQQHRIFAYGSKKLNAADPPDKHTVFEIGSITKSFTCLIAAKNILDGTFANDTAQHYLPSGMVNLPKKNGKVVTLYSLMTHTSGLARTPLKEGYGPPEGYSSLNPYAAYTTDYIYAYLNDYCELLFAPGLNWEYSNTGMGLLGHVIGLADSSDYETVLNREVFDVLGMTRSSLFLAPEQSDNMAFGYNSSYEQLPEFTARDIMQGAGFIKSTVSDMFLYLEAHMGLVQTSLYEAMHYCQQPRLEVDFYGQQCFGWYRLTLEDGQEIVYCGGNTIGFGSYVGFNKKLSTGVILCYNADFNDGANLVLGPEILKAISKY